MRHTRIGFTIRLKLTPDWCSAFYLAALTPHDSGTCQSLGATGRDLSRSEALFWLFP